MSGGAGFRPSTVLVNMGNLPQMGSIQFSKVASRIIGKVTFCHECCWFEGELHLLVAKTKIPPKEIAT